MADKPQISVEAKERILAFVAAVEVLQGQYSVTIFADTDSIAFRDDKRENDWVMTNGAIYGQWDAQCFGTPEYQPMVSREQVEFEEFDGWDE